MGVLLDTAQVDPGLRAELLRERLTSASSDHEVRFLAHGGRVQARLEHWPLGSEMAVMRQTSSGICHLRTERHARQDAPERVAFVVHHGGAGGYEHAGVGHELRRGGIYVTDMSSPFRYERPGTGTALILQIERSAAQVSAEQVQQASRRLEASPVAVLFRQHVLGLIEAAEAMAASELAALVATATLQLAHCLLLDAAGIATSATGDAMQATLIHRVRLYVQLNYDRPELDAELLAHEHHISTRYLYKAWSSQPQTLTEMIIATRLHAARRMLATQPRLAVAAVAHRCGFRNISHFGRRYRAAYGQTPSQTQLQPQRGQTAAMGLRTEKTAVRAEHTIRAPAAHHR
ncbi:MAG: AraC family transcriptional regulator [Jatrophihabitantaceae bacterium]